jgi:hypothetical protein
LARTGYWLLVAGSAPWFLFTSKLATSNQSVSVRLAEAAVVALDGRFDDAGAARLDRERKHGVARVLLPVECDWRRRGGVRLATSHMERDRLTNERAKLLLGHS